MPKSISGSVGRGGRNFPAADVMTVQYLLNCVPGSQGGPTPELVVDGVVGPKTIAAIEGFQRKNTGIADGRVDPGGATLRALQARDPYPGQALPQGAAKGGQPAGQKGYGQPLGKGSAGDPFGQKGYGGPGGKGGAGDPFGQKGYGGPGGKGGAGDPFGQKGGAGMPQGGGGFGFPQKGGGGAKGL